MTICLASSGGKFFDVYRNSGSGSEGHGENSTNTAAASETLGTNTENACAFSVQTNAGSSVEPYKAFTPVEPIPPPPPPTTSDTTQRFDMIVAQGHNTPLLTNHCAFSVNNMDTRIWALETLRRAERVEYYRGLFSEGKVNEGLRELKTDPHAPTLFQITCDIGFIDLDAEIKRIVKQGFNRS